MTWIRTPFVLFVVCVLACWNCGEAPQVSGPYFVDVSDAAGLALTQVGGATEDHYLNVTMAGGGGFLDYDGDGFVDIYVVNGFPMDGIGEGFTPVNLIRETPDEYIIRDPNEYKRPLRHDGTVDTLVYLIAQSMDDPVRNRLFRNNRDGTFSETTMAAGVGDTGYGSGCTVGDYDNDGDVDLYVTNYGPNTLYENQGDGRFVDVTAAAAVGDPSWSVSAAFLDYDRDGLLDLYVVNYLDYHLGNDQICGAYDALEQTSIGTIVKMKKTSRSYCSPKGYSGAPDVLYHNEDDGRFADVTRATGVFSVYGKGLGISTADYDNDGDTDIYVANDAVRNFLFRNDGGRFVDVASSAGAGFSGAGRPEAGMGTDWGDYDNDGDFDIVVANFSHESNTLYRNDGSGIFHDVSNEVGLAESSFKNLTFGIFFFDSDNDGDLDLFEANGHVLDRVHLYKSKAHLTFAEPNQFLVNTPGGIFVDATATSGPSLESVYVSRGSVPADYDNDGDLDLLVINLDGPVQLLRNDLPPGANWISLRLHGRLCNRDAIGAQIRLTCDGRTQLREVKTCASYASVVDIRQHFGLGDCTAIERVEIRWPDGSVQVLRDLQPNRFDLIEQGVGALTTASVFALTDRVPSAVAGRAW